jgi:hypothetical protein
LATTELERRDAEVGELLHVVGQPRSARMPACTGRVQVLTRPVEALREPGDGVHRGDGDAGLAQPGGGRAGRHHLDAGLGQCPAELLEAGLVVGADERRRTGARSGCCSVGCSVGCWVT